MADQVLQFKYIAAAVVYSLLGIVILMFSFIVFDWVTPGKLWDEVAVQKNMPLAIALAAMTLAVGNIIAAAIHG